MFKQRTLKTRTLSATALLLVTGLMLATSVTSAAVADESHASKRAVKSHTQTQHRFIDVDGLQIFYREAGPTNAPTILLLHGFPTSTHVS